MWDSVGLAGVGISALAFRDDGLLLVGSQTGMVYRARSSLSTVDAEGSPPLSFELHQNYPNPFNPKTVVSCQLPVAGRVRVAVYDLLGREVAVLMDERKQPGTYTMDFDGAQVSSGVYICRMTAGSFVACRKMLLLR